MKQRHPKQPALPGLEGETQISVRFSREEKAEIEALADESGLTKTDLIRRSVKWCLVCWRRDGILIMPGGQTHTPPPVLKKSR